MGPNFKITRYSPALSANGFRDAVCDIDSRVEETWSFTFVTEYRGGSKYGLVLDSYERCERMTSRHKFKSTGTLYSRFGSRHAPGVKLDEVPVPTEVVTQAQREFLAKFVVGSEKDFT